MGGLRNFENIHGSFGNDELLGDANDNEIHGGITGDDYLDGRAGNDILDGSSGNDTLSAGSGDDVLLGQHDADTLIAGTDGVKQIFGFFRGSTDRINQNDTVDFSVTNVANDAAAEGVTADLTQGITIDGTTFAGSFTHASANSSGGLHNIVNVIGSDQRDKITGNDKDNIIDGLDGNDTLDGGAGADTLFGGDGDDEIHDRSGNNFIDGGAGNDTLEGFKNDTVIGGDGDDTLTDSFDGGAFLYGNNGRDFITLYGNTSADGGNGDDGIFVFDNQSSTLTGGAGADVFIFSDLGEYGEGTILITDFEVGTDSIEILLSPTRIDKGIAYGFDDLKITQAESGVLVTDRTTFDPRTEQEDGTAPTILLEGLTIDQITEDMFVFW